MAKISRYPNLDLLRALAVMTVVFYHCCNLVGVAPWMWKWLEVLGSSSVELFCILSGFLIGSIYWEEHDRIGEVNIKVFILRRIYRTVPMYYLFMVLAYISVYAVRNEEFSWTYLFFLQNYEKEMPFYVISWTLCVEEHFYLLMPFLVWFFLRIPKKLTIVSLAVLFILPLVFRFLSYDDTIGQVFGFQSVASHFRYESLLLGVVISQILHYHKTFFDSLIPYRYFIYAVTLIIISSYVFLPILIKAQISVTLSGILYGLCLIVAVRGKSIALATKPLTYKIAISSYSTYLAHSLWLHAWVYIFDYLGILSAWIRIPIMFLWSFTIGYIVFKLLEKPIIRLRNRHVPAR
ncbi:putative acyltransferase [Bernardetia litoralis DSM 6794]|uniref:Putative acyltransferase n=1 Tax=Bernardetia litoralis (strain ATCC 23117 / DSM 6794 / NBRC 15988 / NCIMB 1366 / Fx l1 / Sio-4) TaxID=880071 RepID=I4AMS8_BERLS|nr:acyltransferase [Bernardetia litoralis]AFM05263.1 putative acyltransferase [Bernardetia litoralis DSM 6794]